MILGSLLEMYSDVLFKRGQDKNYPTMLLLEEAHHYLRDPFAEEGTQLKAYERLAKKGVSLIVLYLLALNAHQSYRRLFSPCVRIDLTALN